eukprot:203109-Ditylum_brightwellii.AAC.1
MEVDAANNEITALPSSLRGAHDTGMLSPEGPIRSVLENKKHDVVVLLQTSLFQSSISVALGFIALAQL